jgi:cytochrome c biogenesis protein CcmG/thiol:disulfide interchange protein DsbE
VTARSRALPLRPLVAALAVLLVVAGVTAGLLARAGGRSTHHPLALVAVRRPLPAISLPLLSGGGRLAVRSLRGEVTLVDLWASWCTACRAESGTLATLDRELRGRGVRLLGVDSFDSLGPARSFARTHFAEFPSVFDADGVLADRLDVPDLPVALFVGRDGVIHYIEFGPLPLASTRATLLALAG